MPIDKISNRAILPKRKARRVLVGGVMYDRRELQSLYAMARVLTDQVAEISDKKACRATLGASGFPARLIDKHMPRLQHMARTMRSRDAEKLMKALVDQS